MKLEDSDFSECMDEDGHEYFQLNIQEGFKDLILNNQDKLAKIKELVNNCPTIDDDLIRLIKEILDITLVNRIDSEIKEVALHDKL